MRVLKDAVDPDGVPEPRVFANHVDRHGLSAMSTDWSNYCRPEDTQGRSKRKSASEYGVICLNVGVVNDIPLQEVRHAPIFNDPEDPDDPNNRAHTNVLGPKGKRETTRSEEIRARYIAAFLTCGWKIEPPSS